MDLYLITKDNEVSDIGLVQVRVGNRQTDSIITLSYINTQIAVIEGEIPRLMEESKRLQELREQVTEIASIVKLKKVIPLQGLRKVEYKE